MLVKYNNREANPKNKPQISKFTQKHAKISFCGKLKEQNGHEIWQKSNPQYRSLQKTSPRNKQILIKTSQKISNPQVFKKPANPQKNKPKFAGKTQDWQHGFDIMLWL